MTPDKGEADPVLAAALLRGTGTPNFGGPITTASGLVFIGATMDNYLRAFDGRTGQELWKGRLPAGGQATPMTYVAGDGEVIIGFVTVAASALEVASLPPARRRKLSLLDQGKSGSGSAHVALQWQRR